MPKGHPFTDDVREQAVSDYLTTGDSLRVICSRYGVKQRTIYDWVHEFRPSRRHNRRPGRKAIFLTKDETELLLLMILESEDLIPDKSRPMLRRIEDRLLDIADDLTLTITDT